MKRYLGFVILCLLTACPLCQLLAIEDRADMRIKQCDSLYLQGSFSAALHCYTGLLQEERQKSMPSIERIMSIICNLGEVCEDASRLDDALYYYSAYLKLTRLHSPNETGEAYNLIGNVYFRMGRFETATEYYYRAMYVNEKNQRSEGLSSNFNNLGNVFFSWGKYEKALGFYLGSVKLKRRLNDMDELPSCLVNAGNACMMLNQDSNALQYYQEAMQIASSHGNLLRELSARISIGVLEEQDNHLDAAEKQFQIALQLTDTGNSSLERIMALRGMGSICIKRENFTQALMYLQEGYRYSAAAGLRDVSADFLNLMYQANAKNGNYQAALLAYEQYVTLKDSMFNASSNDKLIEFEGRYKNSLRQKTIELQQIEIETRKMENRLLIIMSIAITLVMLGFFLIIRRNMKHKASIQHHIMETRINQARQQALRAQINPHFVSNALNSIQNYYLNGDLEKATGYLADFGQLIRSVLECSTQDLISVADEIRFLNHYLSLEQLRMSNKFTWDIIREGEMREQEIFIPPLLVQPYIENSIWHGISHLEGQGIITVTFKADKRGLNIIIQDNGVGIEQSIKLKEQFPRKRSSFAMSINRERIKLMKEFLGQEIGISIIDLSTKGESGTRVIIRIPELKQNDHV